MSRRAYTILELMTAIVIIGIMASMALPRFQIQMRKVKNQEAIRILGALYIAQIDYKKDTGSYASDIDDLDVSVATPKNFSAPVVADSGSVNCGGGGASYVARMTATEGGYSLYLLTDGEMVCTPCPDPVCQKMGFPVF